MEFHYTITNSSRGSPKAPSILALLSVTFDSIVGFYFSSVENHPDLIGEMVLFNKCLKKKLIDILACFNLLVLHWSSAKRGSDDRTITQKIFNI